MPIITISRQVGSLGDTIAEITAERLGYTLIDKDTIHERISAMSDDFSIEMNSLAEESQPGFFQRIFNNPVPLIPFQTDTVQFISGNHIIINGHTWKGIGPLKHHADPFTHRNRVHRVQIIFMKQDPSLYPGSRNQLMHPVDAAE